MTTCCLMSTHTPEAAVLTALILEAFRLNGRLLADGDRLTGDLGLASPEGDVDEGGFLAALAGIGAVNAVDRQADVGDGGALGSVAHFGIAGEIPDEHDFVETRHDAGLPGFRQD